jgi:hypothetical protein
MATIFKSCAGAHQILVGFFFKGTSKIRRAKKEKKVMKGLLTIKEIINVKVIVLIH